MISVQPGHSADAPDRLTKLLELASPCDTCDLPHFNQMCWTVCTISLQIPWAQVIGDRLIALLEQVTAALQFSTVTSGA